MLNLNFVLLIIFINFLHCSITKADFEKCNKPTIEVAERSLNDILKDYICVKRTQNDQQSSNEGCQENNTPRKKDLLYFDARIDRTSDKCYKTTLPNDCATATECTQHSGIYKIQLAQSYNEPFYVACDAETETGDWLVIQRRQDGSVNFYRDWNDYENGFGDVEGEFFIGLKKLYALTNHYGPQELLIVMEDDNGTTAFAKYDSFAIGDDTESYKLKRIGKYSGSAGNSLQNQVGMKFSTKDRDNDELPQTNCASDYTGAWWYKNCHHSNLNGKYGDNTFGKGINWLAFRGHTVSLPNVKMMIRRSRIVQK